MALHKDFPESPYAILDPYLQFSEAQQREIVFKDITTGEVTHTTLLDTGGIADYRSVIGYFAQTMKTYDFVYVDEESFEKYKPTSFRQLVDSFRKYKENSVNQKRLI